MASYLAKGKFVKVAVGPANGNRVARIIRGGSPIPEGVEQDQLDNLEKRGLIEKVVAPRKTAAEKKAEAEAAAKAQADAEAQAKAEAEAAAKAAGDQK